MSYLSDITTDLVVLVVVFSIADLVLGHNSGVSVTLVQFPVEKVNFLKQFLLMMLKFSDHCGLKM